MLRTVRVKGIVLACLVVYVGLATVAVVLHSFSHRADLSRSTATLRSDRHCPVCDWLSNPHEPSLEASVQLLAAPLAETVAPEQIVQHSALELSAEQPRAPPG